ncbi:hypothetical protein Bbelb_010920 [Branchiostoma belcheri]|nr:hypothetical protein Bbelb_010920 [Branchiostoma belcheri]
MVRSRSVQSRLVFSKFDYCSAGPKCRRGLNPVRLPPNVGRPGRLVFGKKFGEGCDFSPLPKIRSPPTRLGAVTIQTISAGGERTRANKARLAFGVSEPEMGAALTK